jgi:hypothetical protein
VAAGWKIVSMGPGCVVSEHELIITTIIATWKLDVVIRDQQCFYKAKKYIEN